MDFDDELRIKMEMDSEALGEEGKLVIQSEKEHFELLTLPRLFEFNFSFSENWVMRQYDLLMADDNALQELWEEAQLVVCPVCRKGNLFCNAFNQLINCDFCLMAVPARASIQEIRDRIYVIIGNHSETGCPEDTYFFVSHEDSSLYAHCNLCPYFNLAV